MKRIISMLAVALVFSSCGGGDSEEAPAKKMEDKAVETEKPADKKPDEKPMAVTLEVKAVGETMTDMAYEPKRLEVAPGAMVTIKLVNTAAAEAMIHNFVVINFGKQDEVSQAGLAAGPDKDYIPENDNIIAHTPLAHPGETVEVQFKAPMETGTYQFICTYPGHTTMKGVLLVK